MNRILIIILFVLYSFISIGQSRNRFKSYNGTGNKKAVGITLTFLGAGFTACGITYNNLGNNNRTIRPVIISVGCTLTITGLFTLIKK